MKYYFKLDANGQILGGYTDAIHDIDSIQGLTEVSEDAWNARLKDLGANCYKDGVLSAVDFRTDDEILSDTAALVRSERDARLSASDWTQMPDAPLDDEARSVWTVYRQALRDVPQQTGFPNSVTWPNKPE